VIQSYDEMLSFQNYVLISKQLFKLNANKFNQFLRHLSSINENVTKISINESLNLRHTPVMAREVLNALRPKDGQTFIDMTFGSGGHTRHLLSTNKKIRIYALDRDPLAHQKAVTLSESKLLSANGQEVIPLLGRFSEFQTLMTKHNVDYESIDGILIDCGVSSMQFDDSNRGFALSCDGPLDMRMDGQRFDDMPTAADVVNTLSAEHLAKIFKIYGEEKYALKIAQTIVDSRFMMKRLSSTTELANLIANITSNSGPNFDKLGRPVHSATKVFQALRIFVNNELNELNYCLEKVRYYLKRSKNVDLLKNENLDINQIDGGVIAVISFHSLEDRIVKRHFTGIDMNDPIEQSYGQKHYSSLEISSEKEINKVLSKNWKPINKHVILPTDDEILINPRSRSAKLRIATRV
jgi:receptor-type tyrosine-protein phosphatase gamma